MPEPILSDLQLVIEWERDFGLLNLRSFRSEAAGSSIIPFDRSSISFDSSVFGRVNVVELRDIEGIDDLRQHETLLSLLVDGRARQLIETSLEASADQPVRLEASEPGGREISEQRLRWARLALSLESVGAPALVPLERDLQVLQAAAIARDLGLATIIPGLDTAAQRAAVAVGQLSAEDFQRLHLTSEGLALEVLLDVESILDPQGRKRVTTMAELLVQPRGWIPRRDGVGQVDLPTPADAQDLNPRRESGARAFVRDLDARVEGLHSVTVASLAPGIRLRQTSSDECIAQLPGLGERAEHWWLRGFVGGGTAPVAMAPFISCPNGDAESRVLLPPWTRNLIEWDIVDDAGERRPSSPVATFRAAINLGKAAARHERVGDGEAAIDLWYACSELHQRAGDVDRSSHARGRLALSAMIGRANVVDRELRPRQEDVPAVLADMWLPRHRSRTPSRKGPGLR